MNKRMMIRIIKDHALNNWGKDNGWDIIYEAFTDDELWKEISHCSTATSAIQVIDEISGQYIGLMKFQNEGINIIKDFYHKCKEYSAKNSNPLNSSLPFEKSYMTDFLQGLINSNYNLKAVLVENGWLELDSIHDYETYQKMYHPQ